MKKLVFLNTSHVFGGVEKNFIIRAKALEDKGYNVHVVFSSNTVYTTGKDAGLSHLHLIKCSSDYDLVFFIRFLRLLRTFRPDVVFLNTKRDFWRGGLAAKVAGIKRIVGYWGFDYRRGNGFKTDFVFRHVLDRLIVNGRELRLKLLQRGFPIKPENTFVVYNGFDQAISRRSLKHLEIRKVFDIPSNAILLGSAGRLVPGKQFHLAFPLLASLRETRDVRLVLAGTGPEMENLKTQAQNAGVGDAVYFLDNIASLFFTTFYTEIDLFVFFSVKEGLPNVLVESLYYDKYVFALDGDGIKEVLTGIEVGSVCSSMEEMRSQLVKFFSNGASGVRPLRQFVEERFSIEEMLKGTEEVFFGK